MAGIHKRLALTLSSAATSTDGVSIKGWSKIALQVPGSYVVYVQGSQDDVTYNRLMHFTVPTAPSAFSNYADYFRVDYNRLCGGNGMIACPPAEGLNYVKLEVGTAASADMTCYVHVYQ